MAVTRPGAVFTRLTLLHGWQTYSGAARPAVTDISGIIIFKGDILTNGTNPEPFVLPKAFRPATNVYVTSALCGANKGELHIRPTGVVTVQAEDNIFANAQCVTSLDGVSFAKSAASFTKLGLRNGWHNGPNHTSAAAVRLISGIVHFKGAILTKGDPNAAAFVLPKGFRPAAPVYIPVDLCGANKGRLYIQPNGVAHLSAEIYTSLATCAYLDGASFATSAKSFSALKLQNGWHHYGSGTYKPAARVISGVVQFEGAIATSGSPFGVTLFTLPKGMRPAKFAYAEVDLCSANNGRLYIQPNGVVELYAEGGTVQHAQCFTSLDGAWFAR